MSDISEPLRSELAEALRSNDGQLGRVFVLLEEGKTTNRELVEGGAAANEGAVGNLRRVIKTVLERNPQRLRQGRLSQGVALAGFCATIPV